jgi:hypothetical protein
MKAQLYIGDELAQETVEICSPPREGDLVLFRDQRLRVREIGHHIEKKKLRIMCHVPPTKAEMVVVMPPGSTRELANAAGTLMGGRIDEGALDAVYGKEIEDTDLGE